MNELQKLHNSLLHRRIECMWAMQEFEDARERVRNYSKHYHPNIVGRVNGLVDTNPVGNNER